MLREFLNILKHGRQKKQEDIMTEKRKIKYVEEMVCFQEVPDETTLSFSISNCPHRCPGCHSSYLADDVGIPLEDVLEDKLNKHEGLITCVLFMGGDSGLFVDNLIKLADYCKSRGLKTALYSGAFSVSDELWRHFDYIKIGPYVQELGGLDKKTTNQRMYKKCFIDSDNTYWEDITPKFWQKGLKIS